MPSFTECLAVAFGGAMGATTRFLVAIACHAWMGDRFLYATLIVNLVGCFLLGLLIHDGVIDAAGLPLLAHPGLTVGFLGGLTTFSTFGFETIRLLHASQTGLAALNVFCNVVLGCLAVAIGIFLSRYWGDWIRFE